MVFAKNSLSTCNEGKLFIFDMLTMGLAFIAGLNIINLIHSDQCEQSRQRRINFFSHIHPDSAFNKMFSHRHHHHPLPDLLQAQLRHLLQLLVGVRSEKRVRQFDNDSQPHTTGGLSHFIFQRKSSASEMFFVLCERAKCSALTSTPPTSMFRVLHKHKHRLT